MNKKILYLILLGVLTLPSLALAAGCTDIKCMVGAAVDTALNIASGIVIILWVVTGVLFLMAQGAPDKLGVAKKALFTSIAGTILVIVAKFGMDLVGKAVGI